MELIVEYKLLGRLRHNGNLFNIYEDNKYRKFYLRLIENNDKIELSYPTLDEFNALNKIFNVNYISSILCFFKKNDTDDSGNKLYNKKKIKIIPKVITSTGLVCLAMALALTGCGINHTNEPSSIPSTTGLHSSYKDESEMSDEELLIYNYGDIFYEIENGIFVSEYISVDLDNNGCAHCYCCKNMEEFKEKVGMKGSPSYQDLKQAIEKNQNIDEKYKVLLYDGLNNLAKSKEMEGVDFSVLLYNLERMKVIEKTSEEISSVAGLSALAYFSPFDSSVVVNPENYNDSDFKYLFIHEAIGHASTEVEVVSNNYQGIAFSSRALLTTVLRGENNQYNGINKTLTGQSLEEGKADYLTMIACNTRICSSSFDTEIETFREYIQTLGLSLSEVINNPCTLTIINKMKEFKMMNSTKYIINSDNLLTARFTFNDPISKDEPVNNEILFANNVGDFMLDYANSQIRAGKNISEISKEISDIINNSIFKTIGASRFFIFIFSF